MPDIPGDKPLGCGCLSVLVLAVFGASIALYLAIMSGQPDRADDGSLTEAGPLAVTALREGDCVLVDPAQVTLQGMAAVPCDDGHDAQVFATGVLPEGEWPGEDSVSATVDDRCREQLSGVADAASYDVLVLLPIAQDWAQGRGYACLLSRTDGSQLTAEIETTTSPA